MQAASRLGTGIAIRAGQFVAAQFDAAVSALLDDADYRMRAAKLGLRVTAFDPAGQFRDFVAEALT